MRGSLLKMIGRFGTAAGTWQRQLFDAAAGLQRLASSSEKDFLDLGERLQEFHRRTRLMSEMSSQVAERMSGSEMRSEIEGLKELLQQVEQRKGQSLSGAGVLSVLLGRFDEIRASLGYFDRTIKNLRALCSMINIESARLGEGNSNFTTLSEDVKKLAGHMASRTKDLTERLEGLADLVRRHLESIAEYEKKEQGQAQVIIDNTAASLDAIVERYELSSQALNGISSRWVHISKSIGEVVMSLQFHDITRQRIEHVQEVLDDAGKELAEGGTPAMQRVANLLALRKVRGASVRTKRGRAAAAVRLQIAQLKQAEGDLSSAFGRINTNLRGVADDMTSMSLETRRAAGAETQGEKSFLSELEAGFASLSGAISTYSGIHEKLSTSVEQVVRTVRDMSSFIGEIEKIGINMRIIALNACIHAARIGEGGLALGVLAESIHQMSTDTSRDIAAMSENLSATIAETAKLSERQDAEGAGEDDGGRMGARMAALMEPLHRMDGELSEILARIESNGKELARDMEDTLQNMSEHEGLGEGIHAIVLKMEALGGHMQSVLPAEVYQREIDGMGGVKDRYTMETERQIHEQIAGVLPVAAAVTGLIVADAVDRGAAEASPKEDEMGDNVELF